MSVETASCSIIACPKLPPIRCLKDYINSSHTLPPALSLFGLRLSSGTHWPQAWVTFQLPRATQVSICWFSVSVYLRVAASTRNIDSSGWSNEAIIGLVFGMLTVLGTPCLGLVIKYKLWRRLPRNFMATRREQAIEARRNRQEQGQIFLLVASFLLKTAGLQSALLHPGLPLPPQAWSRTTPVLTLVI
ncbi:hypothetical protein EJ08DRAFT_515133 [Tothia fuscella]|uniref:Uncharacterized protein n=1 Tax=Tothia fuscella TaxID=1048955 RepID=A0A9P4TTN2_9PEZI|nr:hypothetical protein EJ08DRAFT_515133 [Tothia fuscella]